MAVIALLAIGFAVYFFYQKRIVNEKNRGLVRLIDETIKYKERFQQLQTVVRRPSSKDQATAPAELKSLSDEGLFQHLCEDIRENQLYLDTQFDRQAVCDRYNLSIAQVGNAFAQGFFMKFRGCAQEADCSFVTNLAYLSIKACSFVLPIVGVGTFN